MRLSAFQTGKMFWSPLERAALGVMLIAALGLRLASASGGLWLDEIWSLDYVALARTLPEWRDRAGIIFHDNTHLLNTIYLFLVGPDASPMTYRGLSVAAGVATVALAWALGRRNGAVEGLAAALLMAVSYPLVHYGGEARGYAPMLAAALGAFLAAELWLEKPSPGRTVAFIVVSLLGIMAHLTFFVVQGAIGLRLAIALLGRNKSFVSTAARLTVLFGVQIVYLTAFAAIAVDSLVIGGLIDAPLAENLAVILLLSFGIDAFEPPLAMIPMGLALALIPASALVLEAVRGRAGGGAWIVPGVVVFVFPLLFMAIFPESKTAPRYFLVCLPFALLLCARLIAWGAERGRRGQAVALVALILFTFGNGHLLAKFFAVGRGDYAAAVRTMAAASPRQTRVAGYHAFRIPTVLAYHARVSGLDGKVRFAPAEEDQTNPAQWYILGNFREHRPAPPPATQLSRSVGPSPPAIYDLQDVFPQWGLSGESWAVYRLRDKLIPAIAP